MSGLNELRTRAERGVDRMGFIGTAYTESVTVAAPTLLALLDIAEASSDVHSRKPHASYMEDDRRLEDALARLREVLSDA